MGIIPRCPSTRDLYCYPHILPWGEEGGRGAGGVRVIANVYVLYYFSVG